MARTDCDVIVIGAGLSGLHAALTLEAVGLRVLVLEAQQRVGGRVHSMRQPGGTAEAGGTYIGAGYTRVIDAAERLGVELMDVTPILEFFREQDLALDGELIRQREWPTHPANDFPERDREQMPWNYHRVLTMRDNPLEEPGDWLESRHAALDISAHDWLRGLGLSERAIALAYGLNVSFGRDAHDVSALLLLFRGAFSKRQRALAPSASLGFTARHGVQRIPEGMAAALAGGVELDHAVVAIELEAESAARHLRQRSPPAREARRGGRTAERVAAHRDRAEIARGTSRGRSDLALAAVDAGLSRAAQPFLGAGRLCREPVHRHARGHARGGTQSR